MKDEEREKEKRKQGVERILNSIQKPKGGRRGREEGWILNSKGKKKWKY